MKKSNVFDVCIVQFFNGMKKIKLAGPFDTEKDAEDFIEEISSTISLKLGQQFGIREILTFDEYSENER